jgi:hypothetical protein
VRTAIEHDAAIGAEKVCEAGRLPARIGRRHGGRSSFAEAAVDRSSDSLPPSLNVEDPSSLLERWLVADVPLVAAGEFGDPLAVLVEVKANDRPQHEASVRASKRFSPGRATRAA